MASLDEPCGDELDEAMREAAQIDEAVEAQAARVKEIKSKTMAIYRAAALIRVYNGALLEAGYSATEAFGMMTMMQGYFLEEAGV